MTIILWIFAVIFILVGFAGVVIPVIPGMPLMFLGFLIAAWIDNFQNVGWIILTALGLLTLLSILVDLASASFGVKRVGASRKAIIGAVLGTFIGLFFGLPGLFAGPILGAVAGEYLSSQDLTDAGMVGFFAGVGLIVGIAVKLGLAFTMIGIFITSFFL